MSWPNKGPYDYEDEDYESERIYEYLSAEAIECSACNSTGEGLADNTTCPICKGKGYIILKKGEPK